MWGKKKILGTMEMVYSRNRYMEGKGKYNRPGRRIWAKIWPEGRKRRNNRKMYDESVI